MRLLLEDLGNKKIYNKNICLISLYIIVKKCKVLCKQFMFIGGKRLKFEIWELFLLASFDDEL